MRTKLIFSLLVIIILPSLTGLVSCSHVHHHAEIQKTPHLCDVDSSEECNNRRSVRPPILQASTSSISVRFFLHKNIYDSDESVELILNNTDSIRKELPDSINSAWKILIPAFPSNQKSPFPNNVRDAYMKSMRNNATKHYNILIVDWDREKMCNLDTKISDSNLTYTGVVGEKVANMLIFLNDNEFLNLTKNVHVIAFSVGAHVAGEAARFVFKKYSKQNLIYRLSALDPTGADFWEGNHVSPWNRMPRVRRSFVDFLDVYHTTQTYGLKRRLGDIDFFLNGEGNKAQPGCDRPNQIDNFAELCSHVYSTEIFARSINDNTMKGCTGCDDYKYFKKDRCTNHKCEDDPIVGEFVDEELLEGWDYPKASGMAYINTGKYSSFGKEFQKRLENAGEPQQGHRGWRQLC